MTPGEIKALVIGIVLVALLAAGAVGGGWLVHAYYAPKLEKAEGQVRTLSDKINEQNTAIGKLEGDAKEQAARAALALKLLANQKAANDADIKNLLAYQPKAGVDRCTAASDLIMQELSK